MPLLSVGVGVPTVRGTTSYRRKGDGVVQRLQADDWIRNALESGGFEYRGRSLSLGFICVVGAGLKKLGAVGEPKEARAAEG